MKRFLAIAAAASTLAGGLGAAAPAVAGTAAPAAASSLKWGRCAESDLRQAGAQCAMLTVPLNYGDPTGATIKIAVSRIKHTSTAAKYQGVILTNPGGPGASGLDLNTFLIAQLKAEGSAADKAAAADYDWIGFDPRGVGSSVPAITCAPYYFSGDRENYNPRTKQILNYWLTRSARYDHRCATHSAAQSALLDNMTTVDTARDMDSIRQALGRSQISYYGFSYGTYLGQVYSTLFPSHVRRLIMDSNVDPRKVWYQANLDQDIAFNRNIKIWFGWLAQHHSFYHLGRTEKTVENRFYAEKARLFRHPSRGWSARTNGSTFSCSPGTTRRPGCSLPACSRTGPTRTAGRPAPRSSACTRVWTRQATTTVSPSTTRSSARTCSGRRAGRYGARTTTGSTDRAVRDLGERLVQRPLPALAGARLGKDPDADQWQRDQQCPADRRDPGCGDAVRGQPGGPPAVPALGAAG